jgi:hypothetical protein
MKIMDDTEKRGPGQPAHKPTRANREDVRHLKAAGISEPVIADKLGIAQNTLRLHYADDLAYGRDVTKSDLTKLLHKAAKKLSIPAIKTLFEQIGKAEVKDIGRQLGGQDQPRTPAPPKLGKKEQADLRARSAGQETGWGNDLRAARPN